MQATTEREIIERVLTKFTGETGLEADVVQWKPQLPRTRTQIDAIVEIRGPQKKLRLVAEAKKNVDRFEILHQLRAYWPKGETPELLLAAPYITPKIAERCREMDLYFADTAGNMYLHARGLHLYVAGKPKPEDFVAARTGKTVHPAGMRIVFALLCQPKLLQAPHREVAAKAQVGLGTVGPVIKDLEKRKHITPLTAGGTTQRRFLQPQRLLEEWVALYPITLRPKLHLRRFEARPKWTAGLNLRPYKAQWGGEVAANRLLAHLEPQTAIIYAREVPKKLIVDQRMRAAENGDVEILDTFWNFDPMPAAHVVPPILAYADLMATTDGRNHEAAKMIYDRFIAPTFTNQA